MYFTFPFPPWTRAHLGGHGYPGAGSWEVCFSDSLFGRLCETGGSRLPRRWLEGHFFVSLLVVIVVLAVAAVSVVVVVVAIVLAVVVVVVVHAAFAFRGSTIEVPG